jgi:hypothetical protein
VVKEVKDDNARQERRAMLADIALSSAAGVATGVASGVAVAGKSIIEAEKEQLHRDKYGS